MNCIELQTLVELLPFDEWAARQLELAERHARTCRACRRLLARAREWESALETLADPVPPSPLAPAVMSRIRSLESTAAPERTSRARRLRREPAPQTDWQLPAMTAAAVTGLGTYLGRLLEGGFALNLGPLASGGWLERFDVGAMFDPAGVVVAAGVTLYLALRLAAHDEAQEAEEP
jgi:hypothetical protein